ncbi:MAG: cysteine desulfurase [Rickettsiales bacterium]|jgi:cysteine desulfurase|nr:cysteine desulfurase [Rickettsiales bacterium]
MNEERIYLDYNSTGLMDKNVIKFMVNMIQSNKPYNPSSIHSDGRKSRGMMENARNQIAKALNIDSYKDDLEIIFTSSGTEANNLAIDNFKTMPVFVGATEHVSILESNHKDMIFVPVDSKGIITEAVLSKLLQQSPGKKLVSIMLANNETGVIQDIKSLSKIVHAENGILHCDASQAFCKIEVNFNDLECDLLTISSHKCGGPLGAAALIAKKGLGLKGVINGGKQEQGLRSGTENLLSICGFGVAATSYKEKIKRFKEISFLRDKIEKELLGAEIIASGSRRLPNTSSIRMEGVKSEEQLIKFDLAGVSVSAGSACSSGRIAGSHVLKAMGLEDKKSNEVVRVSLGLDNTEEEINKFIVLWNDIYNKGL